ncbi:Phosphatidylinositol 3- and 4-kinase [Saccharomonospora azurea SZMC 14600]|uniref:SCO1664 family protein n=1 Tax=Saccharomonospora azurea TaxID=40988 RepID=UPI00023FFE78|nr:SCO1664 family protein [Saccharomonospora azurea]EHK87540.1 Phosphatidylinositol 3- and 4-kinase [Saccharomonospora azurea SZMC 14600]
MEHPVEATDPAATELLTHGTLDVEGRLVDASNLTLFCTLELDGVSAHAVYKPVSGERPLWDFPDGTLAGREAATYLISAASGLGHVPPTVLRDGPFGEGMVQLWIDTTDTDLVEVCPADAVPDGWRVVLHAHDADGRPAVLAHADHPGVRELAALDVVVNNTDRKGGHVLHGVDGRVYGIDHGVCLHSDPKLRTVLWGWIGQPLPDDVEDKLGKLRVDLDGDLGAALAEHLTGEEIRAVADRCDALLADGTFPAPGEDWRALPWPLF